jgi:hypothetical protein
LFYIVERLLSESFLLRSCAELAGDDVSWGC